MAGLGNSKKIELILLSEPTSFSVSPLDSDVLDNLVIMEQIVGTLVKYGPNGSYEPFLSESWTVSDDEKEWTFRLRPNLKDENENEITGYKVEKNLKRLLKIYSKIYTPPAFDQLEGWEEFLKGNENRLGITATGNIIQFKFKSRPSGVLEFLSMPYFGYYSEDDFNGLTWKDNSKITSTGAYRLKKYDKNKIEIEARNSWHSISSKSARIVEIKYGKYSDFERNTDSNLIISYRNGNLSEIENFNVFKTTPSLLTTVILSPTIEPFDNIEVRKAFRDLIRNEVANAKFDNEVQLTNTFYQNMQNLPIEIKNSEFSLQRLRDEKVSNIKLFISKLTNDNDKISISKLFDKVFHKVNWSYSILTPETYGKNWIKDATSNKIFPVRVSRVDIGGSPENWVINMMFCSRLGVSLPDPDGKIKKLVIDYENNRIDNIEEYIRRLHFSIEQDATVIPIFHTRFKWLVSKSIDPGNFSQTMNIPRFDKIEFK